MVVAVGSDPKLKPLFKLRFIVLGSRCGLPIYSRGVCHATYHNTLYFDRTPRPVEHCPLKPDGSACGKTIYAGEKCRACYSKFDNPRVLSDSAYEMTPQARERRDRYELSDKGQAKKRRYARKKAIGDAILERRSRGLAISQEFMIEEIMERFKVEAEEAQTILDAALEYADKHKA